ncbi:hypothetical protein HMPREF1986_01109 [Oribacterium sp. oral taxon 078 str. F0263]|nr:hypothetical protein HMPREF1986_01109 [Oribacterium sp. oral taxon 078 str. F0263]
MKSAVLRKFFPKRSDRFLLIHRKKRKMPELPTRNFRHFFFA